MPSFYNTPMQPTRPTVAAPPINEYREALYDEALPDDPAARMQEMKGRFDRLVRELGVSPRGPPPSGTSKFNTASSPRLPKVPSSKAWGSTPQRVGAAARVVGGADGARAERVRQARAGDGAHGRLHRGADRRVSVAPPF